MTATPMLAVAASTAALASSSPVAQAHGEVAHCRLHHPRYHTLPELRPVASCLTRPPDERTAHGQILVTPRERPYAQPALAMFSERGRLLWYEPRPGRVRDLKVVHYHGAQRLAFYESPPRHTPYFGLLDHRYRLVRRIRAGHGYRVNMHDLQLTPQGTAYLGAYQPVRRRGRSIIDYVLQEVDVRTRRVLFEWHALDHVPTWTSYRRRPGDRPWDYFHGNSIDPPTGSDHTIIVSARNTSAVYGIDRRTGRVRWILGGRADRFGIRERHPSWQFCGQHDARRLPDGDISVFDNGSLDFQVAAAHCPRHIARVEQFRLHRRSATRVRRISSAPSSEDGSGFHPNSYGNAQLQPNGDTLISWGSTARITEVTPDGHVDFGLRLGRRTYRAVRVRWIGRPPGRPAVAAERRGEDRTTVWVSWNGATLVRRWQALAGPSRSSLEPVGAPVAFHGLETRMGVRTAARLVAVQALDGAGAVLRTSAPVRVR